MVPLTESLRILHVVAPAEFGGLERVLHALTLKQVEQGIGVEVAVLLHDAGPDHPFVAMLAESGVGIRLIRCSARAYVREYRELRGVIRASRPHVVHTHGYRCDIIGRRVAAAEGVPVVTTSHGFSRGAFKNRTYEWLQRREFRRFDAVVAVSASMGEELVRTGVSQNRVEVLPNALPVIPPFLSRVESRRHLGITPDEFRVGWIGRFAWAKGLDVFVEALSLTERAPWTASIVGAGPDEARAQALAVERGISPRIVWHGPIVAAAQYLHAFDVLAISSRTEGTPMILLEAMAAGVPIVTTRVGGIPDVVDTGSALLIPPESPAAMAVAIDDVWGSPDAARVRSDAAARRLAAYEPAAWAARYEAVYRRIAGGR